ncbi:NAD(P)-dependent oxidoreductase [Streptomyces sp. AV19]|uniref:NAD(P)-dependent oxidoreductase n=1 Tax=Streptomyces sp. AV19 TaxID=2793068 RepID=UPI0018FE807A|nr:NAD(P)-binding domain-containing protein [Streptomyces sp. AV19]MBH1933645.1 NAD(P)-dependent oxidoreductase [Streptomyces sp. AV19]MDG4535849.1 NAD(P)-binding domain-containing protein [Streptomyces sp. AV19]
MTNSLDNSNPLSPVTVLGLGPMGQALAGALLAAGHPVTVWNRSAGRAGGLVARGAVLAGSAQEAVAASPLAIVCVIDYDAVDAIVRPVAAALRGRTLVNLTADSPDRARETAEWAAAHGIGYLDGSILTPSVSIGTDATVVIYSGPEETFAAHRAVLAAFGGRTDHLGTDPGRAAAFDVAVLDFCWTAVSGYLHALALARTENIRAAELVPYALGIGDLLTNLVPVFAEQVDAGEYPGDQSNVISLAAGMSHVVQAAEARGLDTSLIGAALGMARRVIDAGQGRDGIPRLVDSV